MVLKMLGEISHHIVTRWEITSKVKDFNKARENVIRSSHYASNMFLASYPGAILKLIVN